MSETERNQYEEAAKRKFDAIGRPDDGNEMRAFISGCEHAHSKIEEADREGYNRAIDKARDLAELNVLLFEDHDAFEKFIEELKRLRK